MGITQKLSLSKFAAVIALAIVAYVVVGAFAQAAAEPSITTSIRNTSEGVVTSAPIGASVHAVVQVASSTASTTPQGTVDFNVYTGTACAGSPTTQNNVALAGGFATSSATAVPAGGLSYRVHYDGDINNVAVDGACMPLNSTSNTVTISTNLSANSISAGQNAFNTATLNGETANASGTVAYSVYTNASCTNPFSGAGVVNVVSGNVPNSNSVVFNTPGTYYWLAAYSGDAFNSPATSTCTSQVLTVTATTSETGRILVDKVTNPSGDSTVFSFVGGGASYANFNLSDTSSVNNQVVPVGTYSVSENSTAGWTLTSATCSKNGLATSTYSPGSSFTVAANDVVNCVFTNTKNSTTTPPAGAGTISGMVYNDKNQNEVRDSGEEGLAGFTINLYEGPNFNGDYWPVFKSAVTDGNGNYSFTGLPNGTYSVEQLKKKGWRQTTDDFASVVVSGGAGVGGLDFGDVAKKKEKDSCNDADFSGKNKHKKHCDDDNDNASSTKDWWRNSHDNGWHWGSQKNDLAEKIRGKVQEKLNKAFSKWDD